MNILLEQFKIVWHEIITMYSLIPNGHYDLNVEIEPKDNTYIFKAVILPSYQEVKKRLFAFEHIMDYEDALKFLEYTRIDFINNHAIRLPSFYRGFHILDNDKFSLIIKINNEIEQKIAEDVHEVAVAKFEASQKGIK